MSETTGAATSPRIFDANVMVGPTPLRGGQGDAESLLATMQVYGISEALVAHTYAWRHDAATGNSLLAKELAQHPLLQPCWVVVPWACSELPEPDDFLAQAREEGVLSFRLYPSDHGYDVLGHDAGRMIELLKGYGGPILIDAEQASWPTIEQLAERHPDLPLVVTCIGYRTLRAVAGALERHERLHVDLSYLGSHAGLEWLASRFGSSRILFGSGFPHRDPADAVTRLMWSELDDADVSAIAGDNLRRLLGRSGAPDV